MSDLILASTSPLAAHAAGKTGFYRLNVPRLTSTKRPGLMNPQRQLVTRLAQAKAQKSGHTLPLITLL